TNGTDADNPGNGQPADGTGSAEGEDDGDENGSTGGGDCDTPPVNSGDPLLSQIAMQTWSTRCAISDRNAQQDQQAADLAGEGDGFGVVDEEGIFGGEGTDITSQL